MNKSTTALLFTCLLGFFSTQVYAQAVVDFDGINDNITVPNASSFIANSQLSVSAWVYPTNPSPGWPDFDGILGFRNDVSADFYLLHLSSTSIEARFRNSAGTNYDMVYNGVNLNTWNHFVLTYDNSTLTLYHNGASVMTMPASGSISSTVETFNIGFLPFQANPFYFDGRLDDVALWNTSLGAAEVADLFAACALDLSDNNLVLAYEFNQGTAGGNNTGISNAMDSKNNANGSLNGFALTGTSSNFVGDSKPQFNSYFSLTESSCGPYTSPSGSQVWTTSGVYSDTVFAGVGCDSIYVVDLTVAAPTTSSIIVDECDFYLSPAGNIYIGSGIFTDTISNMAGCDSIISIDLTINFNSGASIQETSCGPYTSPSGDFVWTSSGVYQDTLSNVAGCDSILTIDLTVSAPSVATIVDTACDSYLSPSGNNIWTMSGVYADTIQNLSGCDSVLTIDLTISTIDTSVTQIQSELIANQSGATYQWIDCTTGEIIPGATGQNFAPSSNGTFAVLISVNGCSDTSSCFLSLISSVFDQKPSLSFQLFPNPATDITILSFTEFMPSVELRILNALGQEIETRRVANRQSIELDVSYLEDGLYILRVVSDGKFGAATFVKR